MKEKPHPPGFLEGIFTRQERLALLFLSAVSMGGLAVLGWEGSIPWMNPMEVAPIRHLEVRVNSASAAELAGLPGIGPTLAQRIVEDRQRRGYFLTLADLKRVKGVSRKTLDRIQGYIRFD